MPARPPTPRERQQAAALASTTATVALAQGAPARPVPVGQALAEARRLAAIGDLGNAAYVANQLRLAPLVAVDANRLLLQVALLIRNPRHARNALAALLPKPPRDVAGREQLVEGLRLLRRYDEALALADKWARAETGNVELCLLRARMQLELGDRQLARAEFRRATRLAPDNWGAWRMVAFDTGLADDELAQLEAAAVARPADTELAAVLSLAWRKRRDPAREFAWLNRAQAPLRAENPWSREEHVALTDRLLEACDDGWLAALRSEFPAGRMPIFVVGMPRSGSTLVEQVIASTDRVTPIGESTLFPWCLLELGEQRHGDISYAELVARLTRDDIAGLRRAYLKGVAEQTEDDGPFLDKQLTNHRYVPVLALAFPEAKFIHTDRDPVDTCLSCYQQLFPRVDFAHDLADLGLAWHTQARLMARWKTLLPGRIHTVAYEDMVRSPEATMRALVDFCGLPWTDEVLRFHEGRRGVSTASVLQVRQPIYTESVRKWEPYRAQLAPLLAALERLGPPAA